MTYQMVFFDIDGTLIDEHKRIPADTLEAVKRLQETDVAVAIATGRAPDQFLHIAQQFGIDSYVCCNGGYAQFKGKPVYRRPIDLKLLEAFAEMADRYHHPLVFAGSEACYANREDHPFIKEAFAYLDIPTLPLYDPDGWRNHQIYQVYLYCAEGDEQPFVQRFGSDFRFIRPHRYYLDVFPKDVSKAGGIEAMLRELGIPQDASIAFGDGENDVEMLSFAGLGIAMGNAKPTVQQHADYVTKRVDDGGIADALARFGLIDPPVTVSP
ncbi:Cof-like hydrolase [Alicyclobacillus hesperidum URH17-3-68]|uniref:Cof subfamily of IIB subfamily of haloacid dehalogenase superfamily/HAD-superfamily hydrolase, subfamily IIB n=1 Tax=Alicyclobacillus hesperidum TaxID=89784 RepID=A0A1H2S1Q1_9BACL|nr:Cof-type HAD-IIB family hydrolase [Alicyclobacillus hesperidum]EJY56507.1 Cof-like hydrolase [Alicyclobacillus hesperidum URH17-3-68]SDW25465.1 hypothetical protein SAMN04489725_103229 [Alicyclobacillus hesperidum]